MGGSVSAEEGARETDNVRQTDRRDRQYDYDEIRKEKKKGNKVGARWIIHTHIQGTPRTPERQATSKNPSASVPGAVIRYDSGHNPSPDVPSHAIE